jgi:hypothetical protein
MHVMHFAGLRPPTPRQLSESRVGQPRPKEVVEEVSALDTMCEIRALEIDAGYLTPSKRRS